MDIGQAMKNWKANSGIFGGSPSAPSSSGNDVLNQMQGLGMDTQQHQTWASRQPGQVQFSGGPVGIPRQPWAEGAQAQAVAEAPPMQPGAEPGHINWGALAQLYAQMNQQPQPRGIGAMPVAGRGRQIDPDQIGQEQQALANAAVQPRLLVNGTPLAPRR